MVYLPKSHDTLTTFPKEKGALSKDIQTAIRLINEKWHYHHPEINYAQIIADVTPATDPTDPDEIIGEVAGTGFDPLWGESVDPTTIGKAWEQPHLNEDTAATEVEVYETFIPVHAQIRRNPKEKELKKFGFDQKRDLLVAIPLSLLDIAGITVAQGDYFIHDNLPWLVKQFEKTSYWKNTAIQIYMMFSCDHKRGGS